jgi:hypothetical protein
MRRVLRWPVLPRDRAVRIGLALIVLAQVIYCGALVWRSSFLVYGQRYFGLHDDAMITLTYARNLFEGHGLSWARWGAPVEGYSHPLWLLTMLPSQGLPLAQRPLAVQLLSALFLALSTIWSARIALRFSTGHARGAALLAAFLTASSFALTEWSIIGMETAFEAFLMLVVVDAVLAPARPNVRVAMIASGLAMLLRMDSVFWASCALLVGAMREWNVLPQRWRTWIGWGIAGAAPVIAWEIFRLAYYGDPLPNTYYLKLHGVPLDLRLARGLRIAGETLPSMWHGFVLVFLLALYALRRSRLLVLPLAIFAIAFAYYVYVGADVYDNPGTGFSRFVVHAFPMLAIVCAVGIEAIARSMRERSSPFFAASLATMVALASCASFNHLLDERPEADAVRRRMTLASPPRGTAGSLRKLLAVRFLAARFGSDLRVALVEAGAAGYYSDFELIDQLGYSDREIAHQRGHYESGPIDRRFTPAHNKYDLELVLEERAPDAFIGAVQHPRGIELMREHGFVRLDHTYWIHERLRGDGS